MATKYPSQVRYNKEYNKRTYGQVLIRFRKDDQEQMNIYRHLKSKENKNEYIHNLIRKDMEKEGKVKEIEDWIKC